MKIAKQDIDDFRFGQQMLKSELKAAKKALAKAKKAIRKEASRIKKAETAIGRRYYRDHIQESAGDPEQYGRWCSSIAASEEALKSRTAERDAMTLRINAVRQELRSRKQAFRAGSIPEIILK